MPEVQREDAGAHDKLRRSSRNGRIAAEAHSRWHRDALLLPELPPC
jgi:hypothetical protein